MRNTPSAIRKSTDFTLGDYARLDQWLRSKPMDVIAQFRKSSIHSLNELPAVQRLKVLNPRCYGLLVAEARAQGFPIH